VVSAPPPTRATGPTRLPDRMIPSDGPTVRSDRLPPRLYTLDALRGLAALSVVLWHWQHFFYQGTKVLVYEQDRVPLFALLRPLYREGWRAVDLFFCLSGFVFFWLYAERVRRREVGVTRFAILRLSRLYPLHLATLLLAAWLQALFHGRTGRFFVFPANDAWHFLLNLAFASGWGLQRDFSFNGPSWSVSVEILLYALFFAVCRLGATRSWQLLLVAGAGAVLRDLLPVNVGRGVTGFFMGGLACHACQALLARGASRHAVVALGAATATLWWLVPASRVDWPGYELALFPATVLVLALAEARGLISGRPLAWLGDASYAIYMLHFPLQLAVVLMGPSLGLRPASFFSPLALLAFLSGLVALAMASHRCFEVPAQRLLREQLGASH